MSLADNISLAMVREHVDGLPEFPIPDGFRLRRFQPGDERHWVRIHELADKYNAVNMQTFTKQFGADVTDLSSRQYYLATEGGDGDAIGTASAWYGDDVWGREWGRVHWVAILPEYQGRGLAKPLMAIVMQRMRELRHTRAYLLTSSARVPAIRLYQKFGFVGHPRSEREQAMWRLL
jgi:GNAT superfamily N-acetyltransferase